MIATAIGRESPKPENPIPAPKSTTRLLTWLPIPNESMMAISA